MICRSLNDHKLPDVENIIDVIEHYPRDYQTCFPDMEDGRYATVLGTIVRNSSSASHKFQNTVLTVQVDPDDSKRTLDESHGVTASGTQYLMRPEPQNTDHIPLGNCVLTPV